MLADVRDFAKTERELVERDAVNGQVYPRLLPNSLYRAACFENFEGVFGFFCSVNHLSGGGVMQITTQLTRLLRDGRGNPSNRAHKVEVLYLAA